MAMEQDTIESWVYQNGMVNNDDPLEAYLTSFYWIIQTVITVGYGDIGCVSTQEKILSIIVM